MYVRFQSFKSVCAIAKPLAQSDQSLSFRLKNIRWTFRYYVDHPSNSFDQPVQSESPIGVIFLLVIAYEISKCFDEPAHSHNPVKTVCEYDQEVPQSLTKNLWHREEEPQNNHETSGRQT